MKAEYEIKFVGYNNSGQRRLVVKFTNLVNETDNKVSEEHGLYQITYLKEIALKRAARIGGKRYKSKDFGGGIVFEYLYSEEHSSFKEKIDEGRGFESGKNYVRTEIKTMLNIKS